MCRTTGPVLSAGPGIHLRLLFTASLTMCPRPFARPPIAHRLRRLSMRTNESHSRKNIPSKPDRMSASRVDTDVASFLRAPSRSQAASQLLHEPGPFADQRRQHFVQQLFPRHIFFQPPHHGAYIHAARSCQSTLQSSHRSPALAHALGPPFRNHSFTRHRQSSQSAAFFVHTLDLPHVAALPPLRRAHRPTYRPT